MTIGEVIVSRRKKLGMSQRELARKVFNADGSHISPQIMNCIEKGRRDGSQYINQIASVLQIEISEMKSED
jgi:transcriptional regulator with XRE-family HTH domain